MVIQNAEPVTGLELMMSEPKNTSDFEVFDIAVVSRARSLIQNPEHYIECAAAIDAESVFELSDGKQVGDMQYGCLASDGVRGRVIMETRYYPFGGSCDFPKYPRFCKRGLAMRFDLLIAEALCHMYGNEILVLHPTASDSRRAQLRRNYGIIADLPVPAGEYRDLIAKIVQIRQSPDSNTQGSLLPASLEVPAPQRHIHSSQRHAP